MLALGVTVVRKSASDATSSVVVTVAVDSPRVRCGCLDPTKASLTLKLSDGSSTVSCSTLTIKSSEATQRNWPSTVVREKSLLVKRPR